MEFLQCRHCGQEIVGAPQYCPWCNTPTADAIRQVSLKKESISNKSRLIYVLLTFFLGFWAINRIYLNDYGLGIFRFVFGVGAIYVRWRYGVWDTFNSWKAPFIGAPYVLGPWAFVDLILGILGMAKDKYDNPVKRWW